MGKHPHLRPLPPGVLRRMAADLRRLALRAVDGRQPLVRPTPEELQRQLDAMPVPQELDAHGSPIPKGLTDAEKQAALDPGLGPRLERFMDVTIPPGLQKAAAALAALLGGLASIAPKLPFLPVWVPVTLWGLAAVCAMLAGLPLSPFGGDNPAVPVALVPTFLSMAAGLAAFASTLAPGSTFHGIVMFLSLLCLALAGKAAPLQGHSAKDNAEHLRRLRRAS